MFLAEISVYSCFSPENERVKFHVLEEVGVLRDTWAGSVSSAIYCERGQKGKMRREDDAKELGAYSPVMEIYWWALTRGAIASELCLKE